MSTELAHHNVTKQILKITKVRVPGKIAISAVKCQGKDRLDSVFVTHPRA